MKPIDFITLFLCGWFLLAVNAVYVGMDNYLPIGPPRAAILTALGAVLLDRARKAAGK